MSSPSYSILYSAKIASSGNGGAAGTALLPDPATGLYVVATDAARGTRRTTGIALDPFVPNGVVEIQQLGRLDASISGLGSGSPSWVRVSSGGGLERCSPTGGDDIVGWAEDDGSVYLACGLLTSNIANAIPIGGEIAGSPFYPYIAKLSSVDPVVWMGGAQLGVLAAADVISNFSSSTLSSGANVLYLYDTSPRANGFYRVDVAVTIAAPSGVCADFTIRARFKRTGTTLTLVNGGTDSSPYNPNGWTCNVDKSLQNIVLNVSCPENFRIQYEYRVQRTDT